MILKELLIQYEHENNKNHAEMAELIGVSLSTYYRWITGESTKLKKTTMARIGKVLNYDIESVIDETTSIKPILGAVKAGYDLFCDQDIQGFVEMGKSDAQRGDYFLRVTGDSMEGSHIFDGDLVYVSQTNQIASGKIAVVLVGDEVTVKKVIYKNDLMILEASNPKYETKYYSIQEVEELPVKVIGQVLFVRTDFN